ncbi:MAG: anhydro-N-acetylmuramic acid kinase [Thermonema sp.]|uniref:anhydro-N-acetylmuramic acid kinase n=1 Tax=Thermonema sp. TaxID=2231181 RepID=UPI0021DED059|nr:anhydro-N-acetylmuramic acid kinase [Thermonema sp.]GIV39434.1 MAG: anhydro-N-acetylmuramic acid kinase [Thermonema sp.]
MHKVLEILQKKELTIIGCMSGTSLDGLDIALCHVSQSEKNKNITLHRFKTQQYSKVQKEKLQKIVFQKYVNFEELTRLHRLVGEWHAQMILSALKEWQLTSGQIDLIASHGQTAYHAPDPGHGLHSTLQIGDGDIIALRTGILTISDFRQKHIAGGGEGAPLAPYGDYLLLAHEQESRWLLNIGGIANLTYLPPRDSGQSLWASDCGPGNTLLDATTRHFLQQDYDASGRLARKGHFLPDLFDALTAHPFFQQTFPKSTGQESFSWQWLAALIEGKRYAVQDILHTLCCFTAWGIAQAICRQPQYKAQKIYVSGGGVHNHFLMEKLQEYLPHHVIQSTEVLGIPPDAKEAMLFALLGYECLQGKPAGYPPPLIQVRLGKISLPE